MKVCVLGSGSAGNSIYISCDNFSFLIDAGLSRRELQKRLQSVGSSLDDIRAIVVSHEHSDHTRGLTILSRSYGIPVYLNRATASALIEMGMGLQEMEIFKTGEAFLLGPLEVRPFSVLHDATDPVGFVVSGRNVRVGIATDLGKPSESVRSMLSGCRAIVVEANHDPVLLENHPRPVSLKRRILGVMGHLSNQMAGELLGEVASETLSDVFLAHLSRDCNRPELALSMAEKAIRASGFEHVNVRLTYADRPSDLVDYAPF
jgi:phosphoribosyl 1,2-cyclic phosphodiesterase